MNNKEWREIKWDLQQTRNDFEKYITKKFDKSFIWYDVDCNYGDPNVALVWEIWQAAYKSNSRVNRKCTTAKKGRTTLKTDFYKTLVDRSLELECLHDGGVKKWKGYEVAMDEMPYWSLDLYY